MANAVAESRPPLNKITAFFAGTARLPFAPHIFLPALGTLPVCALVSMFFIFGVRRYVAALIFWVFREKQFKNQSGVKAPHAK
jgi:hypothetical protein